MDPQYVPDADSEPEFPTVYHITVLDYLCEDEDGEDVNDISTVAICSSQEEADAAIDRYLVAREADNDQMTPIEVKWTAVKLNTDLIYPQS